VLQGEGPRTDHDVITDNVTGIFRRIFCAPDPVVVMHASLSGASPAGWMRVSRTHRTGPLVHPGTGYGY
jgi:hypothetical protein